MRFFLTGATGFVGSYVLRTMLERDHAVLALLRPSSDLWRIEDLAARASFVRAQEADSSAVRSALTAFEADAIVHLAWDGVGGGDRNDPKQIGNVAFSGALLQLAHDLDIGSWIGLGSQAEYGPANQLLDESAAPAPTTLYGITKLATFDIARHLCGQWGKRFAWLRLFSSYGPGDHPGWLIPYLVLALLRGERPKLTAGEQRWDYIYVEDAARAIVAVAETETAQGAFNLGSGDVATIRSIVETIRDGIDPALELAFGEVPYRPDQVMHLQADISALRRATGWTPAVPLGTGLQRTVEFYRENQHRYTG